MDIASDSGLILAIKEWVNPIWFSLFIIIIILATFLLLRADILFSSNKSEGMRQLDESEIVDLYKSIVLKPQFCAKIDKHNAHHIIVIEDLDRTENPGQVLRFLKELRKYYLADNKGLYKNRVTFIINVLPECKFAKAEKVTVEGGENISEKSTSVIYPKLFDYTINLKNINIDNFDVIIDGLLKERKGAIEAIGLDVHEKNNTHHLKGLQWIIRGKSLDIRAIKERLNNAFSSYESIINKFGENQINKEMTFEKCAVVAYLIDTFPTDFNRMGDRTFQDTVEKYISGKLNSEHDYKELLPKGVTDEYIKEIKLLVENKHIDINYRNYFYNYPKGSEVLNAAEIKVMNALLYHEDIDDDFEGFVNIIRTSGSDIIYRTLTKLKESDLRFPKSVFKNETLFIEALKCFPDILFETISEDYQYGDEEIDKTIVELKSILSMDKERNHFNEEYAKRLCDILEIKCSQSALLKVRKMLCQDFSEEIGRYRSLFMSPHSIVQQDELEAIADISEAINLIDRKSPSLSMDIIRVMHNIIIQEDKAKIPTGIVESFYQDTIKLIDASAQVEFLLGYMLKMSKIVAIFESVVVKHIQNNEKHIADYIKLVNAVDSSSLTKETLKNLHEYKLYKGLNDAVRKEQYERRLYLDYIYASYYSDIYKIDFKDENIEKTLEAHSSQMFTDHPEIWNAIRFHISEEYQENILAYKFMFSSLYPSITEQELYLIQGIELAIELIEPSIVQSENLEMIAAYFNQKYRAQNETYLILQMVAKFEDNLAHKLFYTLDMKNVQYKRISRIRKAHLLKLFEEKLHLATPKGALDFMVHVEDLDASLERVTKQGIKVDQDIEEEYAGLVKKVDKPTSVTVSIINEMTTAYAYGENVRNALFKQKHYILYVLSSTLALQKFEIENEKASILWPIYIRILKTEGKYNNTIEKMSENTDFLNQIIARKDYLNLPEENRLIFAKVFQTAESLADVLSYGEEFAATYYSSIAGFASKSAAEYFVKVLVENPELLRNQEIYDHTYDKLVNSPLKARYTRERNKIL